MTDELDIDRLKRAMWDGLSYEGVLRIDADSPKELHDVAESVAYHYALGTTCRRDELGGCEVHESIWPEGLHCRVAQGNPSGSYDYGLPE